MTIFKTHPEGCVREVFEDLPLHFNAVFLGHLDYRIGKPAPLKFAFLRRLSYWCDMMYA